jgi:methanogenic corrinoid protein MtbC1
MTDPATLPLPPEAVALFEAFVANDLVGSLRIADRWSERQGATSMIDDLAVPTLEEIGRRWDAGVLPLSQVYISSRICESIVDEFLTHSAVARRSLPRLGIAALNDQHTLGKRVVSLVVRSAGYELIDYGSSANPEELARRAAADSLDILLLSALMLSSALQVERVRRQLTALGAPTRLMVGGAPFRLDPALGQRVGADASGATASDAIRLISELGASR